MFQCNQYVEMHEGVYYHQDMFTFIVCLFFSIFLLLSLFLP